MFAESSKTPLVAVVVLLLVLILNESFILFVDGVVGEMHVLVIFVDLLGVGF